MSRRTLGAAIMATVLLLLASCTPSSPTTGPPTASDQPAAFSAERVAELTGGLPAVASKDLGVKRLASGLITPTNRWFSGLVFGDKPLPVFPLPYSFSMTDSAISFGVPSVTTSAKTIMSTPVAAVTADLGAASLVVSAYDEASVTLEARDASGAALGHVIVAQGSPLITYTAVKATTVNLASAPTQQDSSWWTTSGDTSYGLVGTGLKVSGTTLSLDAGGRATWVAVPKDGDKATLAKLASAAVTGTSVAFGTNATEATTTLSYATTGGDTLIAAMPHQHQTCSLGTYPSIFGTLTLCQGTNLTWSTPTYPAESGLDLAGITADEKTELTAQVVKDVATPFPYPADTYFGGKALYRDAMLWQIATAVGATDAAATVKQRLTDGLLKWTQQDGCTQRQAFCFGYDSTNSGIIGLSPSFGSDEYNDHHFHYGYFLYAAGVLAADDPDLASTMAPVMDALAADIASSVPTSELPVRRNFDVYASHSWASGTSPFADGNNQESSSEAVNAWAGLTLWARASKNSALETEATWMHALEASSARAYWTDFDTSQPVYTGFAHSILPLNFGGKRDYATWFSPEPAALMAILVIPASPSSGHLAGDPDRIAANVKEATANGGFAQTYGDYLLMYSALQGQDAQKQALDIARTLPDKAIDDGDTRSYLLAFLMAKHSS